MQTGFRRAKKGKGTPAEQKTYSEALEAFDIAVCDAIAVGQALAGRLPAAHVGWGSYIYAELCAHATSMVRAAPMSRWVRSDFQDWHFSAVAGHARAILEGYLFFVYIMEPPQNDDELRARINVMNLNDCTRRRELMASIKEDEEEATQFASQQDDLRQRLEGNPYFKSLPQSVQKSCLSGQKPWIKSREQVVEMAGFELNQFKSLWILYSQHSHILPMAFYRKEPNGRGSGLENEVDRGYIGHSLVLCAELLALATDRMIEEFPDTATARCGLLSVFAPGPQQNAPTSVVDRAETEPNFGQTPLSSAISFALQGGGS